tara:strand:+ start:170 stop:529 length:360 start_codon:yes stop_codon:yes gene_type:complete
MKKVFIIFLLSFIIVPLAYSKSSNPLSGNSNSIDSGKKLYGVKCSKCHGIKAKGINNGHTKTPNLRKYKRGYREFVNIIVNGYVRMPAWGGMGVLNQKQMDEIAAFIESLSLDLNEWED